MTTPTWLTQGAGLVAKDDMRRFMKECLEKAGALEDHAQLTADVLINADYQGQFSHGLNHLELYVRQLHTGQCDGQALPHLLAERPAGAWVDGGNALGPVVADFCMRIAIAKAREMGVALVAAKGSNTYGLGSFYTMQAVEKGLIGLIFTNEGPGLAPPGCRKPFLGANPISFAAPGRYKDAFMMNMACSRVCLGKVALRRRQQEWLPRGWALDEFDNVTRDPVEAMRNKRLLPLGCETAGTAGHKGFGLAFMAEVLSGILAGGAVGPDIPHWRTKFDQPVNLSHCFIVIDPAFFAPDYEARLYNMSYRMRGQDPVDYKRKILVAAQVQCQNCCYPCPNCCYPCPPIYYPCPPLPPPCPPPPPCCPVRPCCAPPPPCCPPPPPCCPAPPVHCKMPQPPQPPRPPQPPQPCQPPRPPQPPLPPLPPQICCPPGPVCGCCSPGNCCGPC